MKKAIIVTSAIEVNNDFPLTYSKVRSHFDSEERFRQTVGSLASLDQAMDDDTTVFLIDISPNYLIYCNQFSYQKNLVVVGVKDVMPEIWNTVTSHENKSYCEQLIINTFLERYKDVLLEYDYFIKFSGRYLVDSHFNVRYFDTVKPGFYFKKPMEFEWNDQWRYEIVDNRQEQGDNKLYQYCSVIYGWSKEYFQQYVDIGKVVIEYCGNSATTHYDVETLLFYLTRQYKEHIHQTPWVIYGWDGTSGRFLRY